MTIIHRPAQLWTWNLLKSCSLWDLVSLAGKQDMPFPKEIWNGRWWREMEACSQNTDWVSLWLCRKGMTSCFPLEMLISPLTSAADFYSGNNWEQIAYGFPSSRVDVRVWLAVLKLEQRAHTWILDLGGLGFNSTSFLGIMGKVTSLCCDSLIAMWELIIIIVWILESTQ